MDSAISTGRPVVVLCQPLYGVVSAQAHADLCGFIGVNIAHGFLHGYRASVNAYIDDARNRLVSWVLDETPATHLLFCDQDMILPMGLLEALLPHGKEAVSAVYFDKSSQHLPVGWSRIDPCERLTDVDLNGMQQVAGFGMGAMLLQTDTLRRMAERYGDREWFRSERGGEDLHFCRRLGAMGIPVWLDGRVQCGHLADEVIAAEHWKQARTMLQPGSESWTSLSTPSPTPTALLLTSTPPN